jgi:hypothetical protein
VLLVALNRHPGKGQQKVTVEHAHATRAGGQAVVGMIESWGRGSYEIRGSTCGKQIVDAPGSALPSPDYSRDTLSSAADAERPLPEAQRNVIGAPEGNGNSLKSSTIHEACREGNQMRKSVDSG